MLELPKNTKFSDLDEISRREILDSLLDYKIPFRDSHEIAPDLRFGIEIEVASPNFISKMRKCNDILYYTTPERVPLFAYDCDKWILTTDTSLGGRGGEIDSPILSGTKADWQNIKSMLLYIKKRVKYAKVDDFCASHAHYDANFFNNDPDALLSFMVLLAENEDILTRFYNGEFINLGYAASQYSPAFAPLLYRRLSKLDISSYDGLLNSLYADDASCDHSFSFYRMYLYSQGERIINTFENRIPNGTLEAAVIINNIMVTSGLMEYAVNGNYDYERSLSEFAKNGPVNRDNNRLDLDRAFYVADFLPNNECKLDFLRQYVKDGSETSGPILKKSLEFF